MCSEESFRNRWPDVRSNKAWDCSQESRPWGIRQSRVHAGLDIPSFLVTISSLSSKYVSWFNSKAMRQIHIPYGYILSRTPDFSNAFPISNICKIFNFPSPGSLMIISPENTFTIYLLKNSLLKWTAQFRHGWFMVNVNCIFLQWNVSSCLLSCLFGLFAYH